MQIKLEKIDTFCDYIPLVSTVTNLVNLFQKAVLWCCYSDAPESDAPKNHYYTHLDHKSVFTCIQLMIPVLGNISVALTKLYQSIKAQSQEGLLNLIKDNPYHFHTYGGDYKSDTDFIFKATAASKSTKILQWCSPDLLNNQEFILRSIQETHSLDALKWCSPQTLLEGKLEMSPDTSFGMFLSRICDVTHLSINNNFSSWLPSTAVLDNRHPIKKLYSLTIQQLTEYCPDELFDNRGHMIQLLDNIKNERGRAIFLNNCNKLFSSDSQFVTHVFAYFTEARTFKLLDRVDHQKLLDHLSREETDTKTKFIDMFYNTKNRLIKNSTFVTLWSITARTNNNLPDLDNAKVVANYEKYKSYWLNL